MREYVEEIEQQFPELSPVHAQPVGSGLNNTAYLVNDTWIFRFPTDDEGELGIRLEAHLLPRIAPRLPLAIPVPIFHGTPSGSVRRRFAGYTRIPGHAAIGIDLHGDLPAESVTGWAAEIGAFLTELHAIPPHHAHDWGVPTEGSGELLADSIEDALQSLEQARGVIDDRTLQRVASYLHARTLPNDTPELVLNHGDLAAEHVFVERDGNTYRITGVIDWSDARVTDPAADFSGLVHWGDKEFCREVLGHYDHSADDNLLDRAETLAVCRGIEDITYGRHHGRIEYVVAGMRMIHRIQSV